MNKTYDILNNYKTKIHKSLESDEIFNASDEEINLIIDKLIEIKQFIKTNQELRNFYFKNISYSTSEDERLKVHNNIPTQNINHLTIKLFEEYPKNNIKLFQKIRTKKEYFSHGVLYLYECLRLPITKLKQKNIQNTLTEWLGDNYDACQKFDFSFFDWFVNCTLLIENINKYQLFNILLSTFSVIETLQEPEFNESDSLFYQLEIANKICNDKYFQENNMLCLKIIKYSKKYTYKEIGNMLGYSERGIRYKVEAMINKLAQMKILDKLKNSQNFDEKDKGIDKRCIQELAELLIFNEDFHNLK